MNFSEDIGDAELSTMKGSRYARKFEHLPLRNRNLQNSTIDDIFSRFREAE